MLVFSTQRFTGLSYRADFSRHTFANISFFDAERRNILFHLSLRNEGGMAACNHRGAEPGDWGAEIRRQVPLTASDNQVEIRFDPRRVSVLLNGHSIFGFRARFGRPRFPDLDRIAFVDYQGGIQASTIDMGHRIADGPGLTLTPRLSLRGRLNGPHDPGALRLEIDGTDPAPALIATPAPSGAALWAALPGRVWQATAPGTPLTLRLFDGDRLLSEQALPPQDLLAEIRTALAIGDLRGDPVLATQIIEHARFSGIARDLEPPLQARLKALAGSLGLDRFLDLPNSAAEASPTATPAADAEAALRDALAGVARGLHDAADTDALPDLLHRLSPPAGDMLPLFYVALAEPFCQRGAFDLLHAHARQHLDTAAIAPRDNPWFNSGLLPYLLRDGRIETLNTLLRQLVRETECWLMTPPLAWTVRAALTDPALAETDRAGLISTFLLFLNWRTREYWQRTPCLQLIDTAAALVGAGPRLGTPLRTKVEAVVLRCYGLSADFWDRVGERALQLPPKLAAAQKAFAVLRDSGAPADAQAEALTLFERAGCPEAARISRDLFGPAGLPGDTPTLPDLLRAGRAPGEPALRHMAAPGTPLPAPDLQELAQTVLPGLTGLVDRAPHYALQTATSRRAMDLLIQAGNGTDPAQGCADLLGDLDPLTDARARWIGPGLALGLLNGMLDAGADAAADCLIGWLNQALNRGKAHSVSYDQTPAIAVPLMALRRRAAGGQTNAQAALERLGLAGAGVPSPAPTLSGWVNPLFDTLVVVFSCRAHLDSRIPQMRDGWLSRLAALGVPYVIVTGDGDGTLDGDLLHLDAPDDYEGLPQKTLATIRWVHDHTGFGHMLKIDDDCFLNPGEYFHSLSFRKFDYYGRALTRVAGQMDRAWHCAKSTSPRGRLEFDKSPEPSNYCDGGSGYALSRRAMAELLDAAAGAIGQALIQVSFMEDKLVGDLLALNGIAPANEDYHIAVRRRAAPGGIAVSRWVNGFDASRTAPVKLVHLDDAAAQARANRRLDEPGLFPKKIWPSYQPARLGEQTNALEMVTGTDRLTPAREAPVAVVAAMRNEMFMLPHFLAHYRRLGVESFLIADNCSDDGTLEYLADQPDVALFSVDTNYNRSQYGVAWQQALMAQFRTGRWSLIADADELLTWQVPQRETLPDLLRRPEFDTAEAARIFMLDMYPQGPLEQATFASGDPFAEAGFCDRDPFLHNSFARGPFSNAPTWTSALRHRLIPGSRNELFVAQKIALLKYSPLMRLSAGLHYVAGAQLAPRELLFGHFKYNAGFRRKAQAEVARGQHFNNAEEYHKYLALISEGRDRIYDPDLSLPWSGTAFVKARLKTGFSPV